MKILFVWFPKKSEETEYDADWCVRFQVIYSNNSYSKLIPEGKF